ncbi:MAG: LuxR C-terminal-related transcriptional regulator [Nitrospiria bacterium]
MPSIKIKVIVIETEYFYRKGIICFLNEQAGVEVLDEKSTEIADILETIKNGKPDLIILGNTPSGIPALDLIGQIKLAKSETKLLFLAEKTTGTEEIYVQAFKAGADGCLLKGIEPDQLMKCIGLMSRGEVVVHRRLIPWLVEELHTLARRPILLSEPERNSLTAREEEILKCLAEGKANKEIAQSLKIAEYTVKNHFKKILKKLHLSNRIQAALYAQRIGIVPTRTSLHTRRPAQIEKARHAG